MAKGQQNKELLAAQAQSKVHFEDDPHRAAIEDNPETTSTTARTWASIFVRLTLPWNYQHVYTLNSMLTKE